MVSFLTPDYMFGKYDDITPEFLTGLGKRAVVADIDNTLAPYEQPDPDHRLKNWIREMHDAGIGVAFVSNNDEERVKRFNRELELPAYSKSGKPSPRYIFIALKDLGVEPENAVFLGDQIFTDALAARRAGMMALIVPPIRDKKTLFFRFKRFCEKPVIRRYERLHAEKDKEDKNL